MSKVRRILVFLFIAFAPPLLAFTLADGWEFWQLLGGLSSSALIACGWWVWEKRASERASTRGYLHQPPPTLRAQRGTPPPPPPRPHLPHIKVSLEMAPVRPSKANEGSRHQVTPRVLFTVCDNCPNTTFADQLLCADCVRAEV